MVGGPTAGGQQRTDLTKREPGILGRVGYTPRARYSRACNAVAFLRAWQAPAVQPARNSGASS